MLQQQQNCCYCEQKRRPPLQIRLQPASQHTPPNAQASSREHQSQLSNVAGPQAPCHADIC
jgi:hypothetical protein